MVANFNLPIPTLLQTSYNVLNLQQTLNQSGTAVANYTWLADGTKCGVADNDSGGYDYLGSLIYNRSGSTRTLKSTDFGGGRIVKSGSTYSLYYYITDHLGSVRTIVDDSGTVQERNDYYPFGGKHENANYPQFSVNKQKFNGKELQTTGGTGFLDYGARMYDDVIGRWGVVDPLAEKMRKLTSYNVCLNNPMRMIDPDGKYSYDWESGTYQNDQGVTVLFDEVVENNFVEPEKKKSNNNESEEETNKNRRFEDYSSLITTLSANITATIAGFKYTSSPFRTGYWYGKNGVKYSLALTKQGTQGWWIYKKSADLAKNSVKEIRFLGNTLGVMSTLIAVGQFYYNPNLTNGVELGVSIVSMAFWEVGAIYLSGQLFLKASINNTKYLMNNQINPGMQFIINKE